MRAVQPLLTPVDVGAKYAKQIKSLEEQTGGRLL